MLIAGAGGHAREIVDLIKDAYNSESLFFFDNLTKGDTISNLMGFRVLKDSREVENLFKTQPEFILGLGNPLFRHQMNDLLVSLGGILVSVVSATSIISDYCTVEDGCNLMNLSFISNNVNIGKGSLINARSSLHHDVSVGEYCEISPSVALLGAVKIGNFTSVGAGAIVLPKVRIGSNCKIGAGAVVIKDIPDNSVAVGIPAQVIKSTVL